MKTLNSINSIGRSPLRLGLPRVQSIWIIRGFLLIALTLGCFALSQTARAVLPAPDGGYPGFNTAEGEDALFTLTTGQDNTAIGFNALHNNTTGFGNTATGALALAYNSTGYGNTATGSNALHLNDNGVDNTATGAGALRSHTTGDGNTATGALALAYNSTGYGNTATGEGALCQHRFREHCRRWYTRIQHHRQQQYRIGLSSRPLCHSSGDNNIDIGNEGGSG